MQGKTVAFILVAAFAGFIGGFWLANSINRSAVNSLTPTGNANTNNASNTAIARVEPDLSDAELKAKIAQADANPANFAFQKDLGLALYKYAAMKQEPGLLPDAARILERANSIKPTDFDVLVALGNAHFDIGFATKNNDGYQKAREVYAKALELEPTDPDVQTDLGLTYFLEDPPSLDKAASTLQKVANSNPSHERSRQFLTRVYIKHNKATEAERSLSELKKLNPGNNAIPELDVLVTAAAAK